MAQKTNLAYDLERFEVHEDSEQARDIRAEITVRREKSIHPAKIVLTAALALVMGFAVLYSQVIVTELNSEIHAAERQLNVLQAENVRMQTELEGKMSLKDIEARAIGEYGMVKPDGSQVSYVQFEQESKMEAVDRNENFFEKIVNYVKDCLS